MNPPCAVGIRSWRPHGSPAWVGPSLMADRHPISSRPPPPLLPLICQSVWGVPRRRQRGSACVPGVAAAADPPPPLASASAGRAGPSGSPVGLTQHKSYFCDRRRGGSTLVSRGGDGGIRSVLPPVGATARRRGGDGGRKRFDSATSLLSPSQQEAEAIIRYEIMTVRFRLIIIVWLR